MHEGSDGTSAFALGKPMRDALDIHRSLWLGAEIGAQPHQCFVNAWRVLIEFPDRFERDGRFVEGWFVIDLEDEVVVNEHGWCELADGTIIDPFILLLVSPDQPVFYFPGVIRTWKETEALEGELLPHVRFDGVSGPDGMGNSAYKAAYEAARARAIALANTPIPPKKLTFLEAQDLEDGPRGEVQVVFLTPEHDNE